MVFVLGREIDRLLQLHFCVSRVDFGGGYRGFKKSLPRQLLCPDLFVCVVYCLDDDDLCNVLVTCEVNLLEVFDGLVRGGGDGLAAKNVEIID